MLFWLSFLLLPVVVNACHFHCSLVLLLRSLLNSSLVWFLSKGYAPFICSYKTVNHFDIITQVFLCLIPCCVAMLIFLFVIIFCFVFFLFFSRVFKVLSGMSWIINWSSPFRFSCVFICIHVQDPPKELNA